MLPSLRYFSCACQAAYFSPCIDHMVRTSVKFVPWKDFKPVTADLKLIYQAMTENDAAKKVVYLAIRDASKR